MGMDDYIKKIDALKEAKLMRPVISFNTDAREAVDVGKIISLPAADVEEVKHGQWIPLKQKKYWADTETINTNIDEFYCSVCGTEEKIQIWVLSLWSKDGRRKK